MPAMDDETFGAPPRASRVRHEIGQPLDALSVGELDERIAALTAEMERLQQARRAKEESRTAAGAFFRS